MALGQLGWSAGSAPVAPHSQIGADKGLQVAVNYAIDVSDLSFRTVVFDQTIRLENIGANLRAEINIELGVLDFPGRLALFLHLELIQF